MRIAIYLPLLMALPLAVAARWTARRGTPAAGAWTAEATAGSRRWTILARSRLADGEIASLKRLGVEFADDVFRNVAFCKLDKGEPSWASGLTIDRHDDV